MIPRLLVLLLFAAPFSFAQQPTIPDTPAGHALSTWLDAFNSGDRAKVEAYIKKYDPSENVDGMIGFHNQTGGFNLLSVDGSQPLEIKFHVREKNGAAVALGSLSIKDAASGQVANLGLRAIPPGAKEEDITLDAARRKSVIDGAITQLKAYYIYPDGAQKMADAVLAHEKAGDYEKITDGSTFAARLTDDMQAVTHDRHLHVNYAPFQIPVEHDKGPSPEEEARFRKELEHENCGWEKVEILPGNIGYVKFNEFAPPEWCGPTVVAAMGFLSHVDAIIFDLRQNGGGDPKMVDMVVSYLFDKPTHINDLYYRKDDKTTQYWTLPYLPGSRLATQPVYVLTSKRTFSGGEEFCYDLKTQKRATLVGEATGGGAHPVSGRRIDDHFMIGVPEGRPINPVTQKDWEGTGVEPDVTVKSADALTTAEKLAGDKLRETRERETAKKD
ncbi:MAG TPA: S41 family peptidase [Terracidiphilus sp.]|nr:S41 family peptidase [Terracidiphilus sp.]